ncbi:hypothetical protein [uncultured Methylobacterium sp.]|nr:hypothetical protein [uncultured Methylobacterium sp.]
MPALRVTPTQDGTYTVYRGTQVVVSGLTRGQAQAYLDQARGTRPQA